MHPTSFHRSVIVTCAALASLAPALAALVAPAALDNIPYSGCGTLWPGAECPTFIGDDGAMFSLPGGGGFSLGDRVFVVGEICSECPSICQQGSVFEISRIEACFFHPPSPFVFSECGTLVFTVGPTPCVLFESDSGGLYLIENFGGFAPGDRVRVSTENITTPCVSFCTARLAGCIDDNLIQPCFDPPLILDACGSLVSVPFGKGSCIAFQTDDGSRWMLDDQGGFELGDRLHVTGSVSNCSPLCGDVIGCVANLPPTGCLGDVNSDGSVGVGDLLAVITAWGPCERCAADLDHNGMVNVADLLLVITNWSGAGG